MRLAYLALGLVCVGLGYFGLVTPGFPGTVFFLIALWAFERCSPRLENWLRSRPVIGPMLSDWERDKSLTIRTKWMIIAFTWIGIGISIAVIHKPVVQVVLGLTALCITIYIATRRTRP